MAVVEVTDKEADLLLASIDPLSALASQDDTKLMELLAGVSSDNAAVQAMLSGLVRLPEGDVAAPEAVDMPEPKFDILVSCADEQEQSALLAELAERGLRVRSLIA